MLRKPLHAAAVEALHLIAASGDQKLSISEFQRHMHQRGYDSHKAVTAFASLERRGWAIRQVSTVEITVSGATACRRRDHTRLIPSPASGGRWREAPDGGGC